MIITQNDVNAYVTGEKSGVYSLNLEIHALGLYPKGMTMRRSKKYPDEWWLQPPAHKLQSGKYVSDVEFSTKTDLWEAMLNAALDAVNEYRRPHADL